MSGINTQSKRATRAAGKNGVSIIPTGECVGAEVRGVDLSVPLDDSTVSLLRKAWLDHQVLYFRKQHLTDEQLIAFSRHFGEPQIQTITTYDRTGVPPEIDVVSNVVKDGKVTGSLGTREAKWHTDMSMFDHPASATVLYGIEVPPVGGNTRYLNMYLAYDALPEPLKEKIEGCVATHDDGYYGREARGGKGEPICAVHPLVRTHPGTGRKALFFGHNTCRIHGLSEEESESMLKQIWRHLTEMNDEFLWEHQWQKGDVVMWDNRCLTHSRGELDPKWPRVMRRVTIKGEKPV
jgi:taurine dioxygenase